LFLIKIRENRTEIEKVGGAKVYINEYFLPTVEKIEDQIRLTISEWDSLNENFKFSDMKLRIEKLKFIKSKIKDECNNCKDGVMADICQIIDQFAHFKIYKLANFTSKLDKVEYLLKFKDDLVSVVGSEDPVKEIKKRVVSIDDL